MKESFLINDQSQETKLFFTLELYKTIKVYKNDFDLVLDLLYLFYHDNQHILKGISFIISLFRMQDFNLILDYEYRNNEICIYFISCFLKNIETEPDYNLINEAIELLFAKIQEANFFTLQISQKTTISLLALFQSVDFTLLEKTIITSLLTTKSTVLYIFISNLLLELCKISDYGSVLKRLKKELKTTRFDLILKTEFNPKKYRELRNRVLSSEITYFNSLYKQIESCNYELDPHDLKLFIQASLILNGKLTNSPYDKVINSIINYLKRNNIIDMPIYDILPTRWKIQYMEPENVDDLMDSEGLDLYLCCDYVLRMAKKRKVLAIKEKKKITDFINKKPIYYQ
ncbi:hypothetical protein HK103_002865 [Boothiomyces macroporosus]|uniref:Uncharacterized protein n=1 Tax=Boothiomyces macroporosus TaxID=261099 RepID=A0AAD5Y4Z0_9FUNG|nr:hypothetical protein HK103_002865 [Boothiomyces macroporosus]